MKKYTVRQKLCIEIRRINNMRDIARPRDVCLFHKDIDKNIEKSTAQTIAVFISSHRRALLNSVKKYADTLITGTPTIIQWVRGTNNNDEAIAKIHTD